MVDVADRLQVWFGDVFVGTLDQGAHAYESALRFSLTIETIIETEGDSAIFDYDSLFPVIHLQMRKRKILVEKNKMEALPKDLPELFFEKNLIPRYAFSTILPHSLVEEISWNTVYIHADRIDLYEKVFDHALFEPVVNEGCVS
jgi:hypothetical protein